MGHIKGSDKSKGQGFIVVPPTAHLGLKVGLLGCGEHVS